MKMLLPYEGVGQTLQYMIKQIQESVPYVKMRFPAFRNALQAFYYFRPRVTYRPDPPGLEYIQTVETLFSGKNFHKKAGAGDCDDFTILMCSALIANNLLPVYIIIVGNEKKNASHVYAGTEINGRFTPLDLTNSCIKERSYKYRQLFRIA